MHKGDNSGQFTSIDVTRMESGKLFKVNRPVAVEVSCTIVANGVETGTLLCSPSYLKELAAGFLFSSGLIRSAEDFIGSEVDNVKWFVLCRIAETPSSELTNKMVNPNGRGKGVTRYNICDKCERVEVKGTNMISASQITELANWLQSCSELFRKTGGFHTAGLSIGGSIPDWHMDDISRQSTVDKVIGKALIEGADFSNSALVSSARISSEMLNKACRAGIPIVISRGAPTHRAVLNARDMGITVVGFARGEDFSIYSNQERIKL